MLEKLGKIHVDLGGPYNVPSVNDAKFYMLLTNQAILRTWCYTFAYKDAIFSNFKKWQLQVEN